MFKRLLIVAGIALSACAQAALDPFEIVELPKGEAVDFRSVLAANKGKVACSDYQTSTDSCLSLMRYSVSGNSVRAREVGASYSFSSDPARIEVVSHGRFEGNSVCVAPDDIELTRSTLTAEFEDAVIDGIRALMTEYGGVCVTLYRSGEGFVARSVGRNGKVFPPGDVTIRFFGEPKPVRVF